MTYDDVRRRTMSYDVVRRRTKSYDVVRRRATSYDVVRYADDALDLHDKMLPEKSIGTTSYDVEKNRLLHGNVLSFLLIFLESAS